MPSVIEDLKHALRVFRTNPLFAVTVVAAIALGIGATTGSACVALGAEPKEIRAIVLRQGGRLLAAGVAGGLVAAFYLSSLLASFVFGVETRDGFVFAIVPIVLTTIGLGTVCVVALRAGRVDPLQALRHD